MQGKDNNKKARAMKKYAVLRVYNVVSPSVVFQTDDRADAVSYAGIMNRTDGYVYAVVMLDVTIGEGE